MASRIPKKNEWETCRELWLDQQIELIKPSLIVLLGSMAIQSLLGEKKDLQQDHGTIVIKDNQRFFLTYHPAAALRFPAVKKLMEKDFVKLKKMV